MSVGLGYTELCASQGIQPVRCRFWQIYELISCAECGVITTLGYPEMTILT